MRSRLLVVVSIAFVVGHGFDRAGAKEPPKQSALKESAYYEFRGHIYDRSTIERSFTLYWGDGHKVIFISSETKIFRHGRNAKLQDIKSGDAVRGVGQVQNGRLVAFAVAFGEEGVELPASVKIPEKTMLSKPQYDD